MAAAARPADRRRAAAWKADFVLVADTADRIAVAARQVAHRVAARLGAGRRLAVVEERRTLVVAPQSARWSGRDREAAERLRRQLAGRGNIRRAAGRCHSR